MACRPERSAPMTLTVPIRLVAALGTGVVSRPTVALAFVVVEVFIARRILPSPGMASIP